jgi:predicted secreted protein
LDVNESQDLIKSTQILSVCLLLVVNSGLYAQAIPTQPQTVLQNIAQLLGSASVEVRQDLLTIAMSTTSDGSDSANVQNQFRVALEAALTEARKTAQPG